MKLVIKCLMAITVILSFSTAAQADPFPNADPKVGKKRFDEAKCNACHVSLMGGDGNRIFTRPERKVKDAQALAKMVRFCVSQTGAGIFPEDIDHIAAYLNRDFYKFK
ncbi:MAG: hypothetical protein A3F74_02165 [Betaproteobacteria bacterium RIFCSPLOWO2_12_FULL_62_58]|nr:MAG: hypothetical protein A3I62_02605 [Betaproteobacteria bacterium RIFCSPLOWO2_02_FULL_62_79]OGA47588.1 MAG: hypothetical protein A3F74_02165 [Betaproteobacteria bacterium RIFCSPLOWO2_12_FULL_62_58]